MTARADAPWLAVEYADSGLVVSAAADASGEATVTVSGPTGETALPVQVTRSASRAEPSLVPEPVPVVEQPPAEQPPVPEAEVEPSLVPVAEPVAQRGPKRPRAPALATYGWLAVVLLGLVLLVANLPGSDEYEKAWANPDTGGVEPRTWGDPYIVGSLVVMVSAALGFVRRRDPGRTNRTAGACLGASAFLLVSALVVIAEGHLTDERDWAWTVTLLVAVAVLVLVTIVVRPGSALGRPSGRLAVALLAAAVVVQTAVFGLGPDSYNNFRGWSVLLFPLVLGVLGMWGLLARERSTYDVAAAAAVTFAAVQLFWTVSTLKAVDLDYFEAESPVWAVLLGLPVTLALVVAAIRVGGHRAEGSEQRSGGSDAPGASEPPS